MLKKIESKLKAQILNMLKEKIAPGRNIEFSSIGGMLVSTATDIVGARDYLLQGQYSYNKVMDLNKLTGKDRTALFGLSEGMGPVAFIGLYSPLKPIRRNGYFYPCVLTYNQTPDDVCLPFQELSEEDAKRIGNYTVYGSGDPRVLNGVVPMDKVNDFFDYRDGIKRQMYGWEIADDVLSMERRLAGTYNFADAWYFATGYKGDFNIYDRGEPIQFAIVGENKPVGIIQDVWGYNQEEPVREPIRFLTIDEAKKIDNFKLYVFQAHTYSYRKKLKSVEFEEIDRTFDPRFNFTMEDGTDYRLQKVPEKQRCKQL